MNKFASWAIGIIVLVAIVGGMIWYASGPGEYDQFATCIKNSGATFFGAFWCPHCQAEKQLFGKSWTKLPYVECSTPDGRSQTTVCQDNNIQSYPTWQFKDGSRQTGTLSLEQLSQFTGCALPQAGQSQ
ncbi:MAG: hypothetical protein KGI79_01895 [Patescibacteria group bacterium]|nr:hypothetical protein [Patescibacteria group bacterium]MDE2116604.1 hypothetical protein [Patescibacteria group bacterium]